jgi:hydrogenase maturation protease
MTRSVLVAGIGNIFLGDDAFGVEVVRRLAGMPQPPGVKVADFGIRGVHLAYELLDGYDVTILVDASPRGDPPGTVSVLAVGPEHQRAAMTSDEAVQQGTAMDAHGLTPDQVLQLVRTLGGEPGRVFVVTCEPAEITDRMGLSAPVAAAVDLGVDAVRELIATETATESSAAVTAHEG